MEHVLDNPAWNALLSGNSHLAFGNEHVKYFDEAVSPFVGLKQNTAGHFQILYDCLPDGRIARLIIVKEITDPGRWKVVRVIRGLQMVCDTPLGTNGQPSEIIQLTNEHVPQMLELTKLTDPGPFAARTIEFGNYHGIFEEGQLVAMTGQRMQPYNYTEVSAVCTHPGYTGKGYAQALLLNHVKHIRSAGKVPFLHVRSDNDRAIRVYQSMGFVTRSEVWFYALVKAR